MGIGNLTELTEADTTGVTALLIGFCQELGIRNVLTTEVIEWARGAVQRGRPRGAAHALRARARHAAEAHRRPAAHRQGRRVPPLRRRPSCGSCTRRSRDPNYRIFADADWIYVFNADRFVKGTDFNEIFDQLGVDEATHAFYLGKELMKATIARALRKNYRQESPLDWGYMTFAEPRRERVRLTAQRTRRAAGRKREEDPDPARHRRAPEHVRRDRRPRRRRRRAAPVRRHRARRGARASCSRRSSPAARRTWPRWRCGSAARAWARARRCWPRSRRRSSARSACRRCSTPTAATRPRRRRSRGSPREIDLKGRRVVIVGAGAVGLRAAKLLDRRGLRGHGVGDPGRRASATSPTAARAAWTSRRSAA